MHPSPAICLLFIHWSLPEPIWATRPAGTLVEMAGDRQDLPHAPQSMQSEGETRLQMCVLCLPLGHAGAGTWGRAKWWGERVTLWLPTSHGQSAPSYERGALAVSVEGSIAIFLFERDASQASVRGQGRNCLRSSGGCNGEGRGNGGISGWTLAEAGSWRPLYVGWQKPSAFLLPPTSAPAVCWALCMQGCS